MIIPIYPGSTGSITVNRYIVTSWQAGHIESRCTATCHQAKLNRVIGRRMDRVDSANQPFNRQSFYSFDLLPVSRITRLA